MEIAHGWSKSLSFYFASSFRSAAAHDKNICHALRVILKILCENN